MRKTPGQKSGVFLWVEFLVLFVGGPLLVLAVRRPGILFLLLWVGGLICARLSRSAVPEARPEARTILRRLALLAPFGIGLALMIASGNPSARDLEQRQKIQRILRRFLVLGGLLTLVTRLADPAHFLDLPRQRPFLWLAIMLLYPLLSVWPQEMIYRRFLFHRYAPIFGTGAGVIAASALAFGFAHVIFLNFLAVALTAAGGAMFARNLARDRQLGLCCLEHSLYGCLVFTIGLGRFFYTGAAWHH